MASRLRRGEVAGWLVGEWRGRVTVKHWLVGWAGVGRYQASRSGRVWRDSVRRRDEVRLGMVSRDGLGGSGMGSRGGTSWAGRAGIVGGGWSAGAWVG